MGVVWRAEDTALGREVAIKVLPDAFVGDRERLSRFEREAKLLASLNHRNIATIHGLHAEGEIRFLAMELVRGEDLAKRLERGPLPTDEAIALGRQVAEALEAAHEHGVIHRDLKPANIVVAPDGTVKVLDFGLAKAMEAHAASGDPSLSPTLTHQGTAAGMILGTAAYMSPEQARGRAVDRRADIWAFGCVLLECLTGRRLFTGETVSDVLAAVLRAEVDWTVLPSATPPAVATLLRRCLDRDPRRRLRDIGEARVVLESPQEAAEVAPVGAPRPRRLLPAAVAALALAAASALLAWSLKPAAPLPHRKFVLEHAALGVARRDVNPVLSPDGRRAALERDGLLYVRDLDQLEARPIDEAVDPQMLAWSPDGEWIAFASGTKLMKVPVSGGAVQPIADLPGRPSFASGAAWLPDGNIVFTTGGSGLLSVSSQGGDPRIVLEPAEGENDFHNAAPLPGTLAVVFTIHGKTMSDTLAVFDGNRRKDILRVEGQWLNSPVYAPGGHLLYTRSGNNSTLWAVPFSLRGLETTGDPFLVASGATSPSASADGTLLYTHGGRSRLRQLAWMDRSGELLETMAEPRAGLSQPALSPDGTRVAAAIEDQGDTDIWIADLRAGTWNRLTFTPTAESMPRWFPGGDRVAFHCLVDGMESLCARAADGSGDTEVLIETVDQGLDISPDGRRIVYDRPGRGTRMDVWMREEGGEPQPLLATTDYESSPRVSPDGRLLAHIAWVLGDEDVYLREFPSGGGKWQISTHGGSQPAWGGQELFYVEGGQTLIARRITTSGGVQVGPEQRLFDLSSLFAGFDVSRDGQQVLVVHREDAEDDDELVIVQNWLAEFSGR